MKFYSIAIACVGLATAGHAAFADCNPELQAATQADRFVTQGDATVVDTATGLMWKRCAQGFDWNGSTCAQSSEIPASYSWEEALVNHAEHSFAQHGDWRLPNKTELASIVDYSCFDPAINTTVFPGTPVNGFWSNTPNAFNISFAWAINFSQGEHTTTRKTNAFAVRLVRDFPAH